MKKPTRKYLVKKLDDLTRKIIRLREPNYCVVCGSVESLNLGHIFSRKTYATRWDIEESGNCHIQCAGCNFRHNDDALPYYNWYIKNFGQEKLNELEQRYRTLTQYKDYQLQTLIESYTTVLKSLEENE